MRTRETAFVALGVLVVVAAYAWSARVWLDVVDEGYFLDLSQRVQSGQLPYRDFTTYYTPGIFYLFATVFNIFGTSVLPIRLVMVGLRGVTALLLYLLARRVAPPPLAWLPFVFVAALDHWPIEPEPHPSWPSLVGGLLTLELACRHAESGRLRWLALAGGAAALAFAFKQNVGAFSALGLAGYVVLRPGAAPRFLQAAYVLGAGTMVTLLMRSNLDVLTAAALWLPVLAALGVLLWRTRGGSTGAFLLEAGAAGLGFIVVSVLWIVPLLAALSVSQMPLGLFLGAVDQASIASPMAPFTVGMRVVLLAAIWVGVISLRGRYRVLIGVTLSALLPLAQSWQGPHPSLTQDPIFLPLLGWLDESFGTLHLYLASICVWAGVAALLLEPRVQVGPFRWYVLFGALACLALYPRADTLHAIVSSPLALVVGTGALATVAGRLPGWRRGAIIASWLAVPIFAVAPQTVWRMATLVSSEPQRLDYVELGLARAQHQLVPRGTAEDLRRVVGFIQDRTPSGEPLLVYPAAPLLNFLAERPDPTRFDHFLPGTLNSADFDEAIAALQRTKPRYVVWDHRGVTYWETDPANRPLSDYVWKCYRQVATFRLYLVLERGSDC